MIRILVQLFCPVGLRYKVTFFGGSMNVYGYFKLFSYRGGYLTSLGTISLVGTGAL